MSTHSDPESDATTSHVEEKEELPEFPPIEHWHKLLQLKRLVEDDRFLRIPELGSTFVKQQSSLLLSLPIELRLEIFRHVLTPSTSHDDDWDYLKSFRNRCAIIFTSRQLFVESAPLAFRVNTFKREDLPYDSWLYQIGRFRGGSDIEVLRDSRQKIYEQPYLHHRRS